MFSLVAAMLFGLGITYFAFQNNIGVPINFIGYHLFGIPLYFVVIVAIISGIVMAWFLSTVDSLSYMLKIRGRENTIKTDKKEINALQEKIHDLELENARLRGEDKEIIIGDNTETAFDNAPNYRPSVFNRLFHPRF